METEQQAGQLPSSGVGLAASAHDTSAVAVAETARALVQARYVIAYQRPRNIDDVRARVLKSCERPRFAEAALYSKPVGGKAIEGLSVRFAEEAVRSMGNVSIDAMTVFDGPEARIVRVTVADLEANVPYSQDVTVQKTVERSSLKDGQAALSTRLNTSGRMVYIVAATDDDLANKQAALVSKAFRNLALRLLPADIQEEATDRIYGTLNDRAKKDPDAERKRVMDAFATLNVQPSMLSELLGCDLGQASPAQIVELRVVYQTIRDGETTWQAVIQERRDRTKAAGAAAPDAPKKGGRAAETKAAVAKQAAAGAADKPFRFADGPYKGQAPADLGTDVLQSLVDKGGLSAAALAAIDSVIESRIDGATGEVHEREPGDEGEG